MNPEKPQLTEEELLKAGWIKRRGDVNCWAQRPDGKGVSFEEAVAMDVERRKMTDLKFPPVSERGPDGVYI